MSGVLIERDDRVAVVRLNRPEQRNALSNQLMSELVGALENLDAERKAFHLALSSEDAEEGLAAFLEKRKPGFKGR